MGENPALTVLQNLDPDCHPEVQWRWTQRALLIERDGNTCARCGNPMPTDDMTLDHKIPVSAGGTDHPVNLQLMHKHCNQERGARLPPDPVRELIRSVSRVEAWEDGWRKQAVFMP